MPVTTSKPWLELLALILDETDRKTQEALFEKHEVLQKAFEGNLRQDEFDRRFSEWQKEKAAIEARAKAAEDRAVVAIDSAKKWEKWGTDNVPIHESLLKTEKQLRDQNAQISQELEKIKLEGADVDQAELTKIIDEKVKQFEQHFGDRPNREELNKIVTDSVTALQTTLETKFNQEFMPAWGKFQLDMTDIMQGHREEFKQPLDRAAFMKFMADNGSTDPNKSYPMFVAEEREKSKEEARKTANKAEIDAAVKAALSKVDVPGSGITSAPGEMGVLQMRQQKQAQPEIPEDAVLGDNRLATLAGKALRDEGRV